MASASDAIFDELFADLERVFNVQLENDECCQIVSSFSLGSRLSKMEERFLNSLARSGNRQDQMRDAMEAIRNSSEIQYADNLIYFVLQSRKEYFMVRAHRRDIMTPSRERAISSPPPRNGLAILATPTQTTYTPRTVDSAVSSTTNMNPPCFDRRSASRTRMNRAGSSASSIAASNPTPPVKRRIPRFGGDRRHTELAGNGTTQTWSPSSAASMLNAFQDASPSNSERPPPVFRLDKSDNKLEGSSKVSAGNLLLEQRREQRRPARVEYAAVNKLFVEPQPLIKPSFNNSANKEETNYRAKRADHYVALDVLLKQVYSAIRGMSGMYFRPDVDGVLKVGSNCAVDMGTRALMEHFIVLGFYANQLPTEATSFDEREDHDLLQKSFQSAVFQLRRDYLRAIDILEDKSRTLSTNDQIANLIHFRNKWYPNLILLANLWGLRNYTGEYILDYMYGMQISSISDTKEKRYSESILEEMYRIYASLLQKWLLHADVHEMCGKWLIEDCGADNVKDWMARFKVNYVAERISSYCDKEMPMKILEIGRLVAVLGGAQWDGWEKIKEIADQINYRHFLNQNDYRMTEMVDEMYKLVGDSAMATLLTRDRIKDHLRGASKLYFLMEEPLSVIMYNGIKSLSSNLTGMISSEDAATIFINAVWASGILGQRKDGEKESRIKMDFLAPCGRTPRDSLRRNIVASFCPVYTGASDLASCLLSSDSLSRYQQLFHSIWAIQLAYQAAKRSANEQRILEMAMKKAKWGALNWSRRSWSQILSHIEGVLYLIGFYASELCSIENERMISRVENSRDVSEAVKDHQLFLERMEEELFLKKQTVSVPLNLLLDHAIDLIKLHEQWLADVENHFENRTASTSLPSDENLAFEKEERRITRDDDVEQMAKKYRELMKTGETRFKFALNSLVKALEEYYNDGLAGGLFNALSLNQRN